MTVLLLLRKPKQDLKIKMYHEVGNYSWNRTDCQVPSGVSSVGGMSSFGKSTQHLKFQAKFLKRL